MSTAISVLGGVGLFLLGMTVMTEGLKALAGSALRTVLGKAAATPLRGSFWGALVTLLVQSSSATTMTTISLVSAGLLTFPQGLGLVFGANIGTTGTGWLVALIGVRVSLTAAALPMVFVGALIKLLASGRISGAGAALAGFGLVLFGLTTLQEGMGGVAERLHPADLLARARNFIGRWCPKDRNRGECPVPRERRRHPLETGLRHDPASGNRFDGDLIAAKPAARYHGVDPADANIRTFLSTSCRICASVFVCSDRWAGNEGTSR